MKVNLYNANVSPTAGYTNVDMLRLDDYVDDAEVMELRAIDVLEFFPANKSEEVLNKWIKKLHHGGKIVLGIIDSYAVARGLASYKLDVDEFNLFMYGPPDSNDIRYASFTVPQIVAYLESKGLKILKKRTADYRAIIEAERP